MIRTDVEPTSLIGPVRKAVYAIDDGQPISDIRTPQEIINQSMARRRFNTILISVFASLALILVAAGIYGVMAYSVSQRTHEIGIRIALGAPAIDIARSVVCKGVALAVIGVVLGLIAALGLGRLMVSFLYRTSMADPVTFVMVPLLLLATALLACYLPARRAAKIDPMEALRYE